jgi:glycogen synthase
LNNNIAFVTYETPFSPGGGIAAVMAHLPKSLQENSKTPVFVISPFHKNLTKIIDLEPEMESLSRIKIPFDADEYDLEILLLNQDVKWIFLKSIGKTHQDVPFFAGNRHPYDVQSMTMDGKSVLLRDSLFFGTATSMALSEIDTANSWTVLMQDWEAATTVLMFTGGEELKPDIAPYLTIHNTYDSGISERELLQINRDSANLPGDTVLDCALPFTLDPVFTVSEQFALDLSSEILQTNIMIPHLESTLAPRLVGVNNGPFVQNSVPNENLVTAKTGDYSPLKTWKMENRVLAFEAMDEIQDSDLTPIWGDKNEFDRDAVPWFVMAGRDDSRQKGYEVACIAIDQLLAKEVPARFIFFPIPGDEGLPGIEFIHELADKYPQRVICFPFLFKEGFFAVMRGATYGLMPSYYEPFGMANEYYLSGVVCIGRATGGICQQIVPNRQAPSFDSAAKKRASLWHKVNSPATGFLYREAEHIPTTLEDWHSINNANYELGLGKSNRLNTRKKLPTVQSMADELAATIEDANQLYSTRQGEYFEMLVNGIDYITSNFSWDKAAKTYLEHIMI